MCILVILSKVCCIDLLRMLRKNGFFKLKIFGTAIILPNILCIVLCNLFLNSCATSFVSIILTPMYTNSVQHINNCQYSEGL